MFKSFRTLALLLVLAAAGTAWAHTPHIPDGYVAASDILPLPDFIPGAGSLYIDPANAPVGPWFSFSQEGELIEVLFMVPLSELDAATSFDDLATGVFADPEIGAIDHVDLSYNGGHPGMAEPHYHVRLVLVDAATQNAALAP